MIGYLEHDFVGCDLKTGKQLWKHTLSRGYDEHSAWPLYREPILWTSAPFQSGSRLWELTDRELPTCHEVWHSELMSNDVSSSVLVDETIYGFDLAEAQSKAHRASRGSFRAIDWSTGKERWHNGESKTRRATDFETNRSQKVIGHANVLAADGKLFLLSDIGDLVLIESNPDRYVELARARVLGGEIGWASLALDRERLFVRNRSRAVCLFVGDPKLASFEVRSSQLTVADLRQGQVRDFSTIIGIEPDYAMDPPTQRGLWQWYVAGACILTVAGLLVATMRLFLSKRMTASSCRCAFTVTTFTLGIFVGPIASLVRNEFIFTWPVCLFITFAVAIHRCQLRLSEHASNVKSPAKKDRLIAMLFVVTCGVYFVVCRRLSLVTQWLFLCGFPVAIPALLLDRYLLSRIEVTKRATWTSLALSWLLTQLAFAAYFSLSACLLGIKYELLPS